LTGAVALAGAALTGTAALTGADAGAATEAMATTGNSRGPQRQWLLQERTDHDPSASRPTIMHFSPDGSERASERSATEFLLAAKANLAESAAAGKFLPEGRDALGSATALEATLAQRHAADAPLPASANAGTATPGQVVHLASGVASTAATATIATHLAAAGWDRGLGEKVVWMAGQKLQVAQLHLNPPELGPLQITLTVNNDQASAQFVSQHATVRDAIEAAMPRLREMLAEGGLTLGNTSVSAESFQQQSQQDSRNKLSRGAAQSDTGGAFALTQMLRTTHGLVDIFA
jgi:flagellar hook-length control protein FliK